MTRMTGSECVGMCNSIDTYTYTYTHIASPDSRRSRVRTSDGEAAYGDEWHRAHFSPTGDGGSGSSR